MSKVRFPTGASSLSQCGVILPRSTLGEKRQWEMKKIMKNAGRTGGECVFPCKFKLGDAQESASLLGWITFCSR